MVRCRGNKATYRVNSKAHYLVTLTRLKNNYYGNPRYEATIIDVDNLDVYIPSPTFRFTGHYMGDAGEADWIVKYYENKIRG